MWNKILTTIVRIGVTWVMGALMSHLSPAVWSFVNDIIIQIGGTEALVLGITGTLAVALVSLWTRISSYLHLVTAMRLPKGASLADVHLNSPGVMQALVSPPPAPPKEATIPPPPKR